MKPTPIKPTKDLISATETVFIAMAHTELIRPVVEGYQKELLKFWKFNIAEKWIDTGMKPGIITDPEKAYLMDNEDFQIYLKELHQKHIENGFKVKMNYCPLLIAESTERDAKHLMLECAEYMTKINPSEVFSVKIKEKLTELTLRFIAPFIDNTNDKVLTKYCITQ
jgi:hypothetical protein